MVTVHREGGFRFAIYRNDHEPAHVHILTDGEVIMNLIGPDGKPEIRQNYGSTRADLRKAMRIVTDRQAEFLAKWQEINGGTD